MLVFKHIELDIHFVRERVVAKKLLIQHISVATQIVNTLSFVPFQDLRTKLKV